MGLPLLMMFLGGIIFVGFFSSELFDKTKVSDSVILMGIGIALRTWGLVDPLVLEPLTALVSSLAVAMILFESGLNINLQELASGLDEAFNMSNFAYISNSLGIASLTFLFTGWDPLTSLLVGFILGGTSGAVTTPMAKKMLDDDLVAVSNLETTITNIYNFVFSLSVAKLLVNASVGISFAMNRLLSYFSIGVLLGIFMGLFWIKFSNRVWRKPFSYMRTLAAMLFLYGFAEYAGGSGAVASLVFGLLLGNNKELSDIIKTPKIGTGRFLRFSQELAFLIRTYFLLFMGIVLHIPSNPVMWYLSVAIAIAAFLLRLMSAKLSGLPSEVAFLMPRGLSEAVLISLMMDMGIPHTEEILSLIGLVILVTNVFPSLVLIFWKKGKELKPESATD